MRRSTRLRVASVSASVSLGDNAPLHPGSNASATTPTQVPPLPANAFLGSSDHFPSVQFISETAWPSNLCLNCSKSNWEEWSLQMSLIADRHGFTDWLDGSFPQPDVTIDAKGHRTWKTNDRSLKAFILQHILRTDYQVVTNLTSAASVFRTLCKCHQDLGTHTQVTLITKVFNTCFRPSIPMSHVIEELDSLHTRILTIGPLDSDHLRTAFLVNALGEHYPHLQSMIRNSYENPSF